MTQLSVHVNLAGPRAALSNAITSIVDRATLLLTGVDTVTALPAFLEGVFVHFRPSPVEPRFDDVRLDARRWVLAASARELVEAASQITEEFYSVLCIWELVASQQSGAQLTVQHWNRGVVSAGKVFHRLGLPDKLDRLESHGIAIDAERKDELLSLNALRNCLVHRFGVVGDRDCNCTEGLEVRWSRWKVLYEGEGGHKEVTKGSVVGPGHLSLSQVQSTRLFPRGSYVELSAQEFAEICWSVFRFSQAITESVEALGRSRGHVVAPPMPP